MTSAAPPSPSERFSALIDGLWKLLWARGIGFRLNEAMIGVLLNRLRRMATRFSAIAARAQAGRVVAVAAPRERTEPGQPAAARARPPSDQLPREFGWLLTTIRHYWDVGFFSAELQLFLEDPQVVALLPIAPGLGRVLRPLCRMLAVKPTAALALPKRKRKPRPKVVPEAHPEMWRWPHASFHARFGTKKHRAKMAAWAAYFESQKKNEEGG